MMREDAQLVEMYKLDKNIGNIMAGVLERHSYSVAVTQEAAVGLKYFTWLPEYASSLNKESVMKIVACYQDCQNEK